MRIPKLPRLALIISAGATVITSVLAIVAAVPSDALDPTSSVPTGRNIMVTTIAAQPLATGAMVTPTERMIIVVRGFAPHAPITISLQSGRTVTPMPSSTASDLGELRLVYQVPASVPPGPHALVFTGAGPSALAADPGSGAANVVASVPNFAEFAFRVTVPAAG
jgi:hypothetical protein